MQRAKVIARLVAVLLSGVIAFQAALVAGAPWGEYTQGGQVTGELPAAGRVMAMISIAVLVIFALSILAMTDQGPLRSARRTLVRKVGYAAAAYSAVGVLLNGISRSTAERNLWTPVTLVGFVLMIQVLRLTRDSEWPSQTPL